jgi:RNase adaptor protein for sRNA GlmZ degradation
MATAAAKKWHKTMKTKWLPKLKDGETVAIGCSRGHHRSVSLAVVFGRDLRAAGFTVKYINRDIHKTW